LASSFSLQSAFALLERVERAGGVRELTALTLHIDEWLDEVRPITLPDGQRYPEEGVFLFAEPGRALWLLPRGRILAVPADPARAPVESDLIDTELDWAALTTRLREAVLVRYLGGTPLAEQPDFTLPRLSADLLGQVWDLDEAGRMTVLRALATAMHPSEGWSQAAMRLKAGFERGLGDRSSRVRAVAAWALVRMAAGLGASPGGLDPGRTLKVLFMAPQADVHAATLLALNELPPEVLDRVAPEGEPYVRAALADADPATRHAASELQLRLGGSAAAALATGLRSADAERRLEALRQLEGATLQDEEALLPLVLDTTADSDAAVREAALAVLRPLLAAEDALVGRSILVTLLRAPDAAVVGVALAHLRAHPTADERVKEALQAALRGPEETRPAVVELITAAWGHRPPAEVADGFEALLRDRDPVVRRAALRALGHQVADRVAVRDRLLHALTEHLLDPVASLRLEAARTIVALHYPHAAEIVLPLAVDPQAPVRHGVRAVLAGAGDAEVSRRAEQLAGRADELFDLTAAAGGDDRLHWSAALRWLAAQPLARVPELLAAVLCTIPADTSEPFRRFALEELDAQLLALAEDGDALIALCRRMVEPGAPQPEHAARLAGKIAATEPQALGFLWTLCTATGGASAEAARRALAGIGPVEKSPAVRAELRQLLLLAEDPAQRDVLRTLLGPETPRS
jgi:hypothetical protein